MLAAAGKRCASRAADNLPAGDSRCRALCPVSADRGVDDSAKDRRATRQRRPVPARPAAAPVALSQTSARLFSRLATNLQAPPTLDSLADEFALRKETLIRAFKQDTGLTPASFINIARIEFAKTRLRAGDNIADVGYQAGFADQSHFHKTFVSYTAATPRQYAQSRSITDNN